MGLRIFRDFSSWSGAFLWFLIVSPGWSFHQIHKTNKGLVSSSPLNILAFSHFSVTLDCSGLFMEISFLNWLRAYSGGILVFLLYGTLSTPMADDLPKNKIPLTKVTLQLKWKHQFQFAGYYAALEKGYYRQIGLDVQLIEAPDHEEAFEPVLRGDAEFGIAMSDLVLLRAQKKPVVALAAIYQHSPLILLAPQSKKIQNIHDLVGKKVMMENHAEELLAYLKSEGVPSSKFIVYPHTYDISQVASGEIDAISAYSTDEPFMLKEQGIDYHVFSARSGGIDFYGDVLFTVEAQIEQNPERVHQFLQASLKGWGYALSHSEEIIDLILSKYSQRHSREHLRFEAQQSKRLILPDVVEIGYMNPGRWKHISNIYADMNMIPKNVSLEGFIYSKSPHPDLTWLYSILAGTLLVSLIGFFISARFYKLNKRLRYQITKREEAEKKLVAQTEQLEEKNQQIMLDLKLAGDVQTQLFKAYTIPSFLRIAIRFFPYDHISGDIYKAYLNSQNLLNLFIGDGTGHGLGPALSTMMVNTLLAQNPDFSPNHMLQELNDIFYRNLPEDSFMTAAHLQISEMGQLKYATAGHPPVIILSGKEPTVVELSSSTSLLGAFPIFTPQETSITLSPGDRGYLYTDGITEWLNPQKEMFGAANLETFLREHHSNDLDMVLSHLMDHISKQHAQGVPCNDDITIIAFEFLGTADKTAKHT